MSAEKIRIVVVAVLALSLLTCIALLRPQDKHGVPESRFWNRKFSEPATFDVVAAGDSRILYGVDPQAFEDAGLGKSLNFAFKASPSNEDFYTAATERLSGQGKKILVLGITPLGFTPSSSTSSGFSQKRDDFKASTYTIPTLYGDRIQTNIPALRFPGAIEQRFQPVKLAEIRRFATGRKNPLQETYHPNGWIESAHKKPNEDSALRFYKVRFDGNLPELARIETACKSLAAFIESGVHVFAFKPPVSDSMDELENEKSGFDYADFEKRFSDIGGVWIDVDAPSFKTYDGSHLESKSAREFSQWLANAIKSRLKDED